jgi:hypothetical protein
VVPLNQMYRGRLLKDFVNLTNTFNSIVVKTLKQVLCSCCDDDPLNFENEFHCNIA